MKESALPAGASLGLLVGGGVSDVPMVSAAAGTSQPAAFNLSFFLADFPDPSLELDIDAALLYSKNLDINALVADIVATMSKQFHCSLCLFSYFYFHSRRLNFLLQIFQIQKQILSCLH